MLKLLTIVSLVLVYGIASGSGEECPAPPMSEDYIKYAECCKYPNIVDIKNLETCSNELGVPDEKNFTSTCLFTECLVKQANLVNGDGKITIEVFKKYLTDLFKEASSAWLTIVHQAAEKCIKHGSAKEADIRQGASQPPYNVPMTCNALYGYYMQCISIETINKCPDADKTKSELCNKGFSYFKKCGETYFGL